MIMASLASSMPRINISQSELKKWGSAWLSNRNLNNNKPKNPLSFDKQQSMNFGFLIDFAFGRSLAKMLGGIKLVKPHGRSLQPPAPDCVEIGTTRIVGGIRPQDYDAAYRPDGPRVVFDSKTLNDLESVGKNWRNMINDLATEAATVHTRFPYCLVGFIVMIPRPALSKKYEIDLIRTLERMGTREKVLDENHLAEALSLVVWDPKTGKIDPNTPDTRSNIRIENFSKRFYPTYLERYKGLPPHDSDRTNP